MQVVIGKEKILSDIFQPGREVLKMTIKNCHGISLVEVLVSLSLLMIPLIAFLSLEIGVMKGNSLEQESTRVLAFTRQALEGLKATPYPNIVSGSKQQAGYTVNWTVNENSPENNLKTIDVAVNWLQNDRNRSMKLSTIVAK